MATLNQASHSHSQIESQQGHSLIQRRRTLPAVELAGTLPGPESHGRMSVSTADHDPSPTTSHSPEDGPPPNKIRKVSRACDFCKLRKSKCTGEQPCSKCLAKGRECLYNARYTRGRPPTPPPSAACYPAASSTFSAGLRVPEVSKDYMEDPEPEPLQQSQRRRRQQPRRGHQLSGHSAPPSRASPELGMAEIQGQVFDPTSGLTFLHRAWKRLSARDAQSMSEAVKTSADNQHVTMAGDRPFPETDESLPICLPSPAENRRLLDMYFDLCIATYRIFHRPSVERWLAVVEKNMQEGRPIWHDIGHARAAIVLVALAIAKTTHEKSKGFFSADDESRAQSESDRLFSISSRLTEQETGYPRLESAQARMIQVLYLLTTSRFNRGWYVFGNALQFISAIGLHRRENPKRRRGAAAATPHRTPVGGSGGDYIQTQCKLRTFWTAYILDNYLGVVFGRPRHFHDADIDQDFPDRINDEDMSPAGPLRTQGEAEDFHIDALIFHAKIGQIIGSITREVYTIKGHTSEAERVAAASRLIQQANDWRASLPVHLGSIRPSMLIPTYRRQATVLKLAYSHAIMHASRLFILGNNNNTSARSADALHQPHVDECIAAAKSVLEAVDYMTREGPIFHAFWWTHYVTFCALVVVYVWEIQQRRVNRPSAGDAEMRSRLMELAEKCQQHLAQATATNSPSRRYAVILEEFRAAATSQPSKPDGEPVVSRLPHHTQQNETLGQEHLGLSAEDVNHGPGNLDHQEHLHLDPHLLDEWQTTDWLDLDSSVRIPAHGHDMCYCYSF